MHQRPISTAKIREDKLVARTPMLRPRRTHFRITVPTCSCVSGAQAMPSVTCRTIVRLGTPDDWQWVMMGNDLVAEVFYNASDNTLVDAINFNSYRLRSAAQTLSLHMGPSRSHASIVALSSITSMGSSQLQQHQSWRAAEQKAIGVVNVSLMEATPSIATAAACKPGTPFAMITNMAVRPELRRRGIAHQLMQAAVKAALVDLDVCPPFALLLAYKYYDPAIRLYESWGFAPTPWVDPAWQADAEKGRTARQRRILMVKPLKGSALAAAPVGFEL